METLDLRVKLHCDMDLSFDHRFEKTPLVMIGGWLVKSTNLDLRVEES